MRKEIWDDDLSMISPRYDQKYWLLNNDPAVTLNNRQISVAPQHISVTPQFWSRKRVRIKCYSALVYGVFGRWSQGQARELGSPPLRMALTWKTCQTTISFHQNQHCNRWLAGWHKNLSEPDFGWWQLWWKDGWIGSLIRGDCFPRSHLNPDPSSPDPLPHPPPS